MKYQNKPNSQQVARAGEHFVAAELHRLKRPFWAQWAGAFSARLTVI